MKKMFYKIISVFFALLLIVNTTSSLMRAVEQKCSLGIRYEVEDAEFRLYKIGELDDKGNPITNKKGDYTNERHSLLFLLFYEKVIVVPNLQG